MMRFGMTVSKSKAAATIMISPRRIKPLRDFHSKRKGRVVETVDIFINEHPQAGRAGIADVRCLAVSDPGRIAVMIVLAV